MRIEPSREPLNRVRYQAAQFIIVFELMFVVLT